MYCLSCAALSRASAAFTTKQCFAVCSDLTVSYRQISVVAGACFDRDLSCVCSWISASVTACGGPAGCRRAGPDARRKQKARRLRTWRGRDGPARTSSAGEVSPEPACHIRQRSSGRRGRRRRTSTRVAVRFRRRGPPRTSTPASRCAADGVSPRAGSARRAP